MLTPTGSEEVKRKAKDKINKYVVTGVTDIQDLVRKLNGGGLKIA